MGRRGSRKEEDFKQGDAARKGSAGEEQGKGEGLASRWQDQGGMTSSWLLWLSVLHLLSPCLLGFRLFVHAFLVVSGEGPRRVGCTTTLSNEDLVSLATLFADENTQSSNEIGTIRSCRGPFAS
jgi:hypothetical protein